MRSDNPEMRSWIPAVSRGKLSKYAQCCACPKLLPVPFRHKLVFRGDATFWQKEIAQFLIGARIALLLFRNAGSVIEVS